MRESSEAGMKIHIMKKLCMYFKVFSTKIKATINFIFLKLSEVPSYILQLEKHELLQNNSMRNYVWKVTHGATGGMSV